MTTMTFTKSDEYEVEFNDLTAPWYYSNFGHWFVKAPDLVKLLGCDRDEANLVYKTAIPAPLQTNYLGREVTGLFLMHLNELTEGASRRLWNAVKSNFYADAPATKFDAPVLPYKLGKTIVPALNCTQLQELDSVRRLAGDGSEFDLMKKTQLIVPCAQLMVNDSQMQKVVTGIMDEQHDYKSYTRLLKACARSKLVLVAAEPPVVKGNALRRELAASEAEVARLLTVLESHGISGQSTAHKSVKTVEAVASTIDAHRDAALAALTTLITDHYASLMVQIDLIKETSAEIASVYGSWDHVKFTNLFDNQRITNLIQTVFKQIKARDEVDIPTMTRLIDENLHKDKQVVRQMVQMLKTKNK